MAEREPVAGNQPLGFGALVAGGLLITAALTGDSLGAVLTGKATHLATPSNAVRMPTSIVNGVNSGVPPSKGGLVNPFIHATGLVAERIDMGQDFRMNPGSPIVALADSKLVNQWTFYAGQPIMMFQITDGPNAGRYWYLAEQINPTVHVGQTVAAGQQVATYASSGTGIEIGWGGSPTQTLAQKTTGYTEGQVTVAGREFSALLASLGVPVGGGFTG